jgi:hypothetical protein
LLGRIEQMATILDSILQPTPRSKIDGKKSTRGTLFSELCFHVIVDLSHKLQLIMTLGAAFCCVF